jgi:hypothetical protein
VFDRYEWKMILVIAMELVDIETGSSIIAEVT